MSTDLVIVYRGEYIRGMLNGQPVLTADPDLAKPFIHQGEAWTFAHQNKLRSEFCAVTTRPGRVAQKS